MSDDRKTEKARTRQVDAEKTLPLAEEVATLSKRVVSDGRVDVRTETDTKEELVRELLCSDHVEVTRVPIDRQVDVVPQTRTEGDLTIIPILEEVLVVEKRLMLKEEIHIRRTAKTERFESTVTLRRQRAVIDTQDNAGNPEAPDAPDHATATRTERQ